MAPWSYRRIVFVSVLPRNGARRGFCISSFDSHRIRGYALSSSKRPVHLRRFIPRSRLLLAVWWQELQRNRSAGTTVLRLVHAGPSQRCLCCAVIPPSPLSSPVMIPRVGSATADRYSNESPFLVVTVADHRLAFGGWLRLSFHCFPPTASNNSVESGLHGTALFTCSTFLLVNQTPDTWPKVARSNRSWPGSRHGLVRCRCFFTIPLTAGHYFTPIGVSRFTKVFRLPHRDPVTFCCGKKSCPHS